MLFKVVEKAHIAQLGNGAQADEQGKSRRKQSVFIVSCFIVVGRIHLAACFIVTEIEMFRAQMFSKLWVIMQLIKAARL